MRILNFCSLLASNYNHFVSSYPLWPFVCSVKLLSFFGTISESIQAFKLISNTTCNGNVVHTRTHTTVVCHFVGYPCTPTNYAAIESVSGFDDRGTVTLVNSSFKGWFVIKMMMEVNKLMLFPQSKWYLRGHFNKP